MSQTSRLVIELDTRSAEQKTSDLRRALQGLNDVGVRSGPVFTGAGAAISKAGVEAKDAAGQVSALERQIKTLTGAASGLAGPLAAAFSVKQLYDAVEAYSTLTNRLKLVTDGSSELAAAQKAIFSIAQEGRQPLSATAELYQRIATNQKELSLTGEGVAGIVRTISKTMAISGASAASANAALVQLGQAFASGTLRGEELNSVMEQAPALSQAIAAGMGKTVGELRALGAEGALTADAVVKSLQSQARAVDEQFSRMAPTIGSSLTAVGNSFTNFVGQLDQAMAGSSAFANQILAVSKTIDGALPASISAVKENASELEQVLTTGLYVALGRVAGGYAQQAASALYAANASRQALNESAKTAQMSAMIAQAKQIEAKEGLALANMQIRAAEGQVASERALAAAELEGIRATQAALVAERELEQQRLRSQISAKGRAASVSRLAEISQASTTITKQVEAAEKNLAATTVASSAAIEKAYSARAAAALAYAETAAAANSAVIASERAASAASVTSRALSGLRSAGVGLLGVMGGPLGLAVTAGAVALSFADFRSESERLKGDMTGLGRTIEAVREVFNKLNRDQQQAKVNEWRDKQLGAAMDVKASYGELKDSIKSAMIDTSNADFIDVGKVADQARAYDAVIEQLDAAKSSGQALGPILREAAASGQVSPAQLKSWEQQAGLVSDNIDTLNTVNQVLDAQTGIMDANTTSTQANNEAKAGLTKAGETYLGALQKQLGKLQDNNSAVKEANRYLSEHADLSDIDRAAILSAASAVESQEKANKAAAKSARDLGKAYQENAGQKMLDEARQRYAVLMQQKSAIDDQGSGARTLGVEAKKLIELEIEIAQLKEKKTLTAAQKQVLAMADLNLAQQKQNAALEQANKLDQQRLENAAKLLSFQDQLNDALATEQQGLDSQIAGLGSGKKLQERIREDLKIRQDYQKQLAKLQRDYQRIVNPTAEQTSLYENETNALKDALGKRLSMQEDYYKRVDAAQSDWAIGANDAWHDYLDEASDISGQTYDLFSKTFTGIEDAIVQAARTGKLSFKDLADSIIADLARMAARAYITVPLLQMLGIGGGGSGSGLGGGGSSGGGGLGSLLNFGKTLYQGYSALTGVGSSISAGYASGGLSGAFQGGVGYYGNMLSGIAGKLTTGFNTLASVFTGATAASTAATVASQGLTASALSGAVSQGAASLGAQFGTGVATTTAATYAAAEAGAAATAASIGGQISAAMSSAAAAWPLAVAMGMYQSGKLYDAGVRYKTSEVTNLDIVKYDPLAKASLAGLGLTDKIASKVIGGKLAAIFSGSTFASAALGKLNSKLFGGSWQTKDVGFSLGVESGEFEGRQFEYQKKKGGLFGKNKKRTRYSALDPEMQAILGEAYDSSVSSVEALFKQLNITLSDGVLDGLNVSAVKISTKNKTGEEIQAELDKFFADVAQKTLNALSDATGSGFTGMTVEQLAAFVNQLYAVNGVIKHLNIGLFETSVAGGRLAEQMVATAGGFDALAQSAATYYDAFYTDAEKTANTLTDVRDQFAALNLALPETRAGYRGLIESLDKSTESGRNAIAAYLSLSGAADQMYDILENSAESAKAALIDSVSGALAGVQRAVSAQRDAITKAYTARTTSLNDMLSTAQRSVTDLTGVSSSLEGALKSLRGTSDDAVTMLRSQSKATLENALSIAKAGGSLSGVDGLSDALDVISSNNTSRYASLEDYLREQGQSANLVSQLEEINGKQLTNAEKTVKTLESQLAATQKMYDAEIAALDDQLALAQAQVDAINGVDNSVKSVADAVLAMSNAVLASLSIQAPGAAAANTYDNNAAIVKAVYRSVLGRDAEAKGLADWTGALSGGLVTYESLIESIIREARANGEKTVRVPGFASGGDFGGGIRLVGERGPELELTGPSRIFNAQKTADMLSGSGGGAASEIRALREEMKAALFAIAKNTLKAAKNTDLLPRKLEEELFA